MQVSVENVSNLERKLIVKIPAEQLETQVRTRIQEMGRSVRLKGFRPGKVPAKVIEQRYGAQIRGEALSGLVRETFQEAVEQQKLRPAMAPSISTTGQPADGEIEYTATFEVLPELGAIDVSQLAVIRPIAAVGEADVDHMIETLRQQRRSWTPVERIAQTGDMVLFEYSAQGGDFRYPESGKDRVGTIIGSGAMAPQLEDQLIGQAAESALEIDIVFPTQYRVPQLAGKLALVDLKVIRVQEPKLPELDQAFISSFGVQDGDLSKFKQDVRANLERELKANLNARLKAEVVQKLVESHPDIALPNGLVEAEAAALARQAEAQAKQQGQEISVTPDQYRQVAARRVAAGLLLSEIARQNDVRLDSRRVAETLSSIASTYEEPERVIELYSKDPQLMTGLQSRVLEDQVADWIADHAKVSERTLSFDEVMRPNAQQ